MFEYLTQTRRPKGRKETHEAIDRWAGVTPEARALKTAQETARIEAEKPVNQDRAIANIGLTKPPKPDIVPATFFQPTFSKEVFMSRLHQGVPNTR